ncbi:MAG TPA: ABC transporter ATP-binding protein [Ignavibacteriaceae bacterium]|nr:ABC transporter ATP-binding protein [Ignavibacteriaceae bacterium]
MNTYLRILKFVKPYWKHLTFSIICTILFALLNGLSIYLTIPLLQTLFQEGTKAATNTNVTDSASSILPQFIVDIKDGVNYWFNNFVFQGTKIDALLRICVLVLFTFLLKNIFGYMQAYFLAHVEQGAMKDLRNKAYDHLQRLPISYYKQEKTGNLISKIINDVNIVQGSIAATFLNLIREPLSIIVFLGIAIGISWQLTLVSFIILPFIMFIITSIGLRLRKHSSIIQAKMGDITSILQETISGVKIVKAFSMEDYERNKFKKETYNYFKLLLRITRVRNLSSPITEILSVIVGVIIIYYGGILVLQEGTITASEFLGFLFAIFQMMPPIKELSGVNNRIQETSAAADRVFQIIDIEPAIKNIENPITLKSFSNSIIFDNVSFKYEDAEEDEYVLRNINLKVNKGEILALVGPSGGGKTTFVDLLPRFYDTTSGRILIDGIDIKKVDLDSLRRKMGIVTQETFLFNESIEKNIAYGLDDINRDEVIEAAKMANAHNFIMAMPNKYETVIGDRGVKLSGGQRQRLSIARALLKNPEIMIFDEATSALDNESEILVQEAIERLMENRTTFVIAHRLSTIRNASKIIVIDRGRIVQEGTNEELLRVDKGLYKKLYEMQFKDE